MWLGDNVNLFKPKYTIVIFIHYKPWIAVAILVVNEDNLKLVPIEKTYIVIIKTVPRKCSS